MFKFVYILFCKADINILDICNWKTKY